ncbi:hypothetical protein FJTKL_11268 [Diaporthe vaccinii]|uniref:Uncharacterized protein n=1 Tax=Diaporthe vaccinii TaxID=105482 RepID=A0ABR4EH66_9PEZI
MLARAGIRSSIVAPTTTDAAATSTTTNNNSASSLLLPLIELALFLSRPSRTSREQGTADSPACPPPPSGNQHCCPTHSSPRHFSAA